MAAWHPRANRRCSTVTASLPPVSAAVGMVDTVGQGHRAPDVKVSAHVGEWLKSDLRAGQRCQEATRSEGMRHAGYAQKRKKEDLCQDRMAWMRKIG